MPLSKGEYMSKAKVYPMHPGKAPELKKHGAGVYTIEGYTPPKSVTTKDVRRIVRDLLAPVKVESKG
jgi:hypothetical protein